MGRRSRLKRERKHATKGTLAAMAMAQATAIERFERVVGRKVDASAVTAPGTPKMSDTLLDFARPLIDMAGRPLDARRLDGVLSVATVIWNAYLLGAESSKEALAGLRDQMGSFGIEAALCDELVGFLLDRRRNAFGDDRRVVGSFAVVQGPNGKLQVTATYLPPSPALEQKEL